MTMNTLSQLQAREGELPEFTGAAPRRVLIVDDNPDAAEMMAMVLQLDGHEVRVAHDAEGALTLADAFQPHVGLFDIGLPQTDGYELARRVRRHPQLVDMYLVAITGWGQAEDRERAVAAGFDSHITKPAEPDAVRRLVAGVKRNGR